jgi:Ni/Co efflux regulator RcnB
MRTLALAALTMVTAFGAGGAEAQRIGQNGGTVGAPYPVPSYSAPSMPAPPQPMPPVAYPGQVAPPQPYPAQSYPGQSYPGRPPQQTTQRRWGGYNGGRWSGGSNAPGGWKAYRRPHRGYALPQYWFSPSFYIADFGSYGLAPPPAGYSWHRYYDDAVLVDGRGRVWDSVNGLDWDGAGYGQGGYDGYASGYSQSYGQSYGSQPYISLPPVVQNGTVTTYSTGGYVQGGYAASGYAYAGPTTTVVIQGPPIVTTTTTTTEYVEESRTRYVAARRVYRAAPKRHYRPVRRPSCGCRRVEQPVQGS